MDALPAREDAGDSFLHVVTFDQILQHGLVGSHF